MGWGRVGVGVGLPPIGQAGGIPLRVPTPSLTPSLPLIGHMGQAKPPRSKADGGGGGGGGLGALLSRDGQREGRGGKRGGGGRGVVCQRATILAACSAAERRRMEVL
jgi:hypothetical protein